MVSSLAFILFLLKASHILIYAVSPACSSNSGERSSVFYFLMPFPFPPSFPHKIWKSVRFKSFRLLPSFSQPPPSLPPTPGIIWSPVSVVTSMSPLLSEYLHGGSLFPVLALCPSSPTSESPGYFDSNSSLRPSSVVWNLQRLNNSFWLSPIYPSCNMPQNDLAFYCHPSLPQSSQCPPCPQRKTKH